MIYSFLHKPRYADLNERDSSGATALTVAVKEGGGPDGEAARLLRELGVEE